MTSAREGGHASGAGDRTAAPMRKPGLMRRHGSHCPSAGTHPPTSIAACAHDNMFPRVICRNLSHLSCVTRIRQPDRMAPIPVAQAATARPSAARQVTPEGLPDCEKVGQAALLVRDRGSKPLGLGIATERFRLGLAARGDASPQAVVGRAEACPRGRRAVRSVREIKCRGNGRPVSRTERRSRSL